MQPFYGLTSLLSPKVVGGLVVVLLLVIAVPVGLKLTDQRVSTSPQASKPSTPIPGTSIELELHQFNCEYGDLGNGIKPGNNCNAPKVDKTFAVDLKIHSDVDPSNLIRAQITFNPELISVEKVVTKSGSSNSAQTKTTKPKMAEEFFITLWVGNSYKNDKGTLQLIGSVPNPGFLTSAEKPATMARIYFKAKKTGNTTISLDKSSSMYRNADNQNILKSTKELSLEIK